MYPAIRQACPNAAPTSRATTASALPTGAEQPAPRGVRGQHHQDADRPVQGRADSGDEQRAQPRQPPAAPQQRVPDGREHPPVQPHRGHDEQPAPQRCQHARAEPHRRMAERRQHPPVQRRGRDDDQHRAQPPRRHPERHQHPAPQWHEHPAPQRHERPHEHRAPYPQQRTPHRTEHPVPEEPPRDHQRVPHHPHRHHQHEHHDAHRHAKRDGEAPLTARLLPRPLLQIHTGKDARDAPADANNPFRVLHMLKGPSKKGNSEPLTNQLSPRPFTHSPRIQVKVPPLVAV
ncbi:hypothetical protein STENM223S_06777 [Streptomyces tendae]